MKEVVRIVTPPTTEVLTLQDAQIFCKVDDNQQENALIESLIKSARGIVEKYLNRCLLSTTYEKLMNQFPDSSDNADLEIELLPCPVISITTVKYYNSSNVLTTLAETTDYLTSLYSEPASIYPVNYWESAYERHDAVQVRFVAGYANKDEVPEPIKTAMLLLVKHFYDNREAVTNMTVNELPFGIEFLLSPYRIFLFK